MRKSQRSKEAVRHSGPEWLTWISVVQPMPDSGSQDAEMPFAKVTMSGCTSKCWKPNILPVRPKPVMTCAHGAVGGVAAGQEG